MEMQRDRRTQVCDDGREEYKVEAFLLPVDHGPRGMYARVISCD